MNSFDKQFCENTLRYSVFETKRGFSVHGHYYDKQKIQPVKLQVVDPMNIRSNGDSDNSMNLSSDHSLVDWSRTGLRYGHSDITYDPYIEDVYYTIVGRIFNTPSGSNSGILAVKENNNNIETINTYIYDDRRVPVKIVDVTKKYIYAIVYRDNNAESIFIRYDKNTGAREDILNLSAYPRNSLYFIYKSETDIYLLHNYRYDQFVFYRYAREHNAYTNRGTGHEYNDNNCNISYIPEDFLHKDNLIHIYYPYSRRFINEDGQEKYEFCIKYVTLDISLDVTQNDFPKTLAVNLPDIENPNEYFQMNNNFVFRSWIVDNYFYLAFYGERYLYNNYSPIRLQRMWSFKILPDNTLECIFSEQLDTKNQVLSMCFSSDKKFINLGFNTSFRVMKLDETTKQYRPVTDFISDVQSTGFDEYDRIWIQYLNGCIETYSVNDPYEVTLSFEKKSYTYIDTDIESYILFSSQDFSGLPAKGQYSFEIKGTVHFKDNGKKTYKIDYTSGIIQIPIIVTGSDQLTCKVYFLKESG